MRSTAERRMTILEYMCERRHETLENLMFEFDVSRSTIIRNLSELSRHYPLYTRPGNGGGVHMVEGSFWEGSIWMPNSMNCWNGCRFG